MTNQTSQLIPLDPTLLICGVPSSYQSRSSSWSKKGLLERMDRSGITDIDTSFGFIVYFRCTREQLDKFNTRFKIYAQTTRQYVYIMSQHGQGPKHWYK
jgi:hypothetical protein